jgi:hypothetical protein
MGLAETFPGALTAAPVSRYDVLSGRLARLEVGMAVRITAIREMLGEYEEERTVALSRLDRQRLRRTQLELAREVLVEHGEAAEADRVRMQIHNIDHDIQAGLDYLAEIDRLIAIYRASLDRLLHGGPGA